jgi:outer membrane biogenesis lipoprotein LolB
MKVSVLRRVVGILLLGSCLVLLTSCSGEPEKKIDPEKAKNQWKEINDVGKKERGI